MFPFGGGRINIGLGYVNSYKNWQQINATQFLGEFMDTLPREWDLPPIEELKKNKIVRAWRLPMGFTAWPPWRPGVLFTGDSLGAGKPASGAGISKALESGLAAGECAIAALTNGGPDDFTNYAQRMEAAWGREYRRGRYFHKLAGIPAVANNGIKLIDNAVLPRPAAQVDVQEGTGAAAPQGQVAVSRCPTSSAGCSASATSADLRTELDSEGVIDLGENLAVMRRFSGSVPGLVLLGKRLEGGGRAGADVAARRGDARQFRSDPAARAVDCPWDAVEPAAMKIEFSDGRARRSTWTSTGWTPASRVICRCTTSIALSADSPGSATANLATPGRIGRIRLSRIGSPAPKPRRHARRDIRTATVNAYCTCSATGDEPSRR